jgi:hypothetical protein
MQSPSREPQRRCAVSNSATRWALDETDLSGTRKLVLVKFADHADKETAQAYPGVPGLAKKLRCSDRTVRRHIADLVAAGYMREGDQSLAAKIPADRRPIVYELAMSEAAREHWEAHAQAAGTNPRREAASAAGTKGFQAKASKAVRGSQESMRQMTPTSRNLSRGTAQGERPDTDGTDDLTIVPPRPDTRVSQTTSGTTKMNHQTTDAGLTPTTHLNSEEDDALLRDAQLALGDDPLEALLVALAIGAARAPIAHPRAWLLAALKSKHPGKERNGFVRSLWWSDAVGHLADAEDGAALEDLLEGLADDLDRYGSNDCYSCEPVEDAPAVWDYLRHEGVEWPGRYLSKIADDGVVGVWKIVRDAMAWGAMYA